MFNTAINMAVKYYLSLRYGRIVQMCEQVKKLQSDILVAHINRAKDTLYGQKYSFKKILNYEDFRTQVPIVQYEDLETYISDMMYGTKDVLWPGEISWYAKSSGTTGSKSKYIPISKQNLYECHIAAAWDAMSIVYHQRPDSRNFADKSLIMGGSIQAFDPYPSTMVGDVSAILLHHMPSIGRPFYTPDFDTALLADMDTKLEKIIQVSLPEDVVMLAGVPTWSMVLFNKILERTGKTDILKVWPNASLYMHGGVGFEPYREQFKRYFPSDTFDYMEIYNASEGYFALQDRMGEPGLMLLINNDIFYEFVPLEELGQDHPKALAIWEVKMDKNYAMLVTSSCGLWRYMPGDTVKFISKNPYRIKITGRTKQYINAFGEEVMICNTDEAISLTCKSMNAEVSDYTVAPIYINALQKGGHEWLIEFKKEPADLHAFGIALDLNLQELNSDYQAKRYKNLALNPLAIKSLPVGTFHLWLKSIGKVGAQIKVPRLSNDRTYVNQILQFIQSS
jgi:hypothetical protein